VKYIPLPELLPAIPLTPDKAIELKLPIVWPPVVKLLLVQFEKPEPEFIEKYKPSPEALPAIALTPDKAIELKVPEFILLWLQFNPELVLNHIPLLLPNIPLEPDK